MIHLLQLADFVPLRDPLPAISPDMDSYWLLLVIPLVVAISIIYKGTRLKEMRKLPFQATLMSFQILILMVVAAAALNGLYFLWVRIR